MDILTGEDFWSAGWSCGWAGDALPRFLAVLPLDLGRPLTGGEQQQVRAGYHTGLRERVEFDRDQAARGPVVAVPMDEVPF